MKLTELEPQFMTYETRPYPSVDAGNYIHRVDTLVEAQGIIFLCPVCFAKNNGPVGTHAIEVSFAGRDVQDHQGSHSRDGQPVRWNASGSTYDDLTLTPSILIDECKPACDGWHGFITNGAIT